MKSSGEWDLNMQTTVSIRRSSRADGRPSPYSMRMGVGYVWDRKLDHHFGAKVISHVKEDHRMTSFALPAEEGIWVGRSTETPGADISSFLSRGTVVRGATFWANPKRFLGVKSTMGTFRYALVQMLLGLIA